MTQVELARTAALCAALTWAIAIVWFRRALAEYGPWACNTFKIAFPTAFFAIVAWLAGDFQSENLPSMGAVVMLALSGIVGMALGDYAFLSAMLCIGDRRAAILHATNPVFLVIAALIGTTEGINMREIFGVLLIVGGVIEVISSKRRGVATGELRLGLGIFWGLLAALGQALGVILSKEALAECPTASASFFRLAAGTIVLVVAPICVGRTRQLAVLRQPGLWKTASGPTSIGTCIGVLLMMFAVKHDNPAVTGALLATTPVFLVPVGMIMFRDRLSWRQLLGIVVTVAGAILLKA